MDEKVMDLLESLYQAHHQIPVEKAREIYLPLLEKGNRKAFLFYFFFDRNYASTELSSYLRFSRDEEEEEDDYVSEKINTVRQESLF